MNWHKEYPISAPVEDVEKAVNKLMANDPADWADNEVVREDLRAALIDWLSQYLSDILESPAEHVFKSWSGFDETLRRIRGRNRQGMNDSLAVIVTKGRYEEAARVYNDISGLKEWRLEDGNLTIKSSSRQDEAYDAMVAARAAYLAEVERVLKNRREQGL